jgi:hypothetical protein
VYPPSIVHFNAADSVYAIADLAQVVTVRPDKLQWLGVQYCVEAIAYLATLIKKRNEGYHYLLGPAENSA